MVLTRSKQNASEEESVTSVRKISSLLADRLVNKLRKKTPDTEEEEVCESYESDIEDEYQMPSTIEKDAELTKKFQRVLQNVEKKEQKNF